MGQFHTSYILFWGDLDNYLSDLIKFPAKTLSELPEDANSVAVGVLAKGVTFLLIFTLV